MKRKHYLKMSDKDRRNYLELLVMRVFGTRFDDFAELTELQTGNADAALDQLKIAGDKFVVFGTPGNKDCRFMVRERYVDALVRASRSFGDGHPAGASEVDEGQASSDAGGHGVGAEEGPA
jgi:hypothetical protein